MRTTESRARSDGTSLTRCVSGHQKLPVWRPAGASAKRAPRVVTFIYTAQRQGEPNAKYDYPSTPLLIWGIDPINQLGTRPSLSAAVLMTVQLIGRAATAGAQLSAVAALVPRFARARLAVLGISR